MAGTMTTQSAPMTSMQGIAIPAQSVNPDAFKALTRRHTQQEGTKSYDSTGAPAGDVFLLRKSDILAGLTIRFAGKLVVGAGATASTTARWPYDFLKAVRFTANGASNLINVSGAKLKIRDMMKASDLTDRGVSQSVANVVRNQGTLARATESWGIGSRATGIAPGTYDVELEWFVPVAEDMKDLTGAIFLATSSSDLTLSLDYETPGNLFAATGGTIALTGQFAVTSHKFSIPVGGDGQIVVPNLNAFHSLIQSSYTALGTGENEVPIVGQGAGKALLRIFYQHWNGAGTAQAPLPMTAANFGLQAWRYATNETPDQWIDGTQMRHALERNYNSDLGALHGVGCHEFAGEDVFRDVVDMGTTSEFRLVTNIMQSVTLTNQRIEYVLETVYGAGGA